MFGIGIPELVVVLVIILIIFGVGKLPEIGSGLGKAIKGFKRGVSEGDSADGADQENPSRSESNDKKS